MRITTRLARKPPLFCLLLTLMSVSACDDSSISSAPKAADSGSDIPTNSSKSEWMTASNWDVVSEYMFEDHGKVLFKQNQIVLEGGDPATGIRFNGTNVPNDSYEVSFDAMRVSGNDFFCGMTLPIGSEYCTLILGGWSGTIVGLSNVDEEPAAENMTATSIDFVNGRWYAVRVEVSPSIRVWIDGRKVIELDRAGRKFSLWWEQEEMAPFGIATWGTTTAAIRNLQIVRPQPAAVEK